MASQPQLPAMMARQLLSKMAGGGAPPQGGPGGSPGGPVNAGPAALNAQPNAGQQISQQLAELQGADPQSLLKILTQMKSMAVPLYARSAFTVPGVARNIAQMQKYLDNAIKEAEQAAATASTVQPPIANNTGISQPQPEQGGMGLEQFSQQGAQ